MKILGTGTAFPTRQESIQNWVERGHSRELLEKWGVESHFIATHETATSLEVAASKQALETANVQAKEIDLIIGSSFYPDQPNPPQAIHTQEQIGATNAVAFNVDMSSVSSILAMSIASQFIRNNTYKKVLVIASSCLKDIRDSSDPRIDAVVGDGAAALVLGHSEADYFFFHKIQSFGQYWNKCGIRPSATATQNRQLDSRPSKNLFYIDQGLEQDTEFVNFITRETSRCVEAVCQNAGIERDEIDWICPHQNIKSVSGRWLVEAGFEESRIILTSEKYGNVLGANNLINLAEGYKDKLFREGDIALLASQSNGFCMGAALVRL